LPPDASDRKFDCLNAAGSSGGLPMARYTVETMVASLVIEDTPIRYTPPRGPAINFMVSYNQREVRQPQTFKYSNLGPKWTFNWLSYVTDDPNNPSADVAVFLATGGSRTYSGFDAQTQSYPPDAFTHAALVRTSPTTYERRFPDGSKHVFALSDASTSFPRKVFMTQVIDPAGNAATIVFDSNFRITAVT